MNSNSFKILIVGPSWIGDMVIAQSLFKLLDKRHPKAELDIIAPEWSKSLLRLMPEVQNIITIPISHNELSLGKRLRIGRNLRERQYNHAIILPRSFKSAIIPFIAHAKRRTGFLGELRLGLLNDVRRLNKKLLPRTVDRFISLGIDHGETMPAVIPTPTIVVQNSSALGTLARLGEQVPKAPVLGLCPGAEYGPAKRWPPKYFASVANKKLEQGWNVWLFGSNKDVEITNEINERTQKRCIDFGGKTSLADAIDLMSLSRAVVSNDSGLMHVAAAIGLHTVAIYGSSDPEHTPPLSDKVNIFHLGLSCSPCFKRKCPYGHYDCLYNLKPEQILDVLSKDRLRAVYDKHHPRK